MRLVKDQEDDKKMYDFLEDRHPFPGTTSLRNIVTGVEVGDHVDVYKAHKIGEKILQNMVGKNVLTYKYKRNMAMHNVVISRAN